MTPSLPAPRWESYILVSEDELKEFWRQHSAAKSRNVLFVLRKGFDPRMCDALTKLIAAATTGTGIDVLALEVLDETDAPRSTEDAFAESNWERLKNLAPGKVSTKTLEGTSDARSRARGISHSARGVFASAADILAYSDVVVDISAMPRTVFFPMIARLLHFCDQAKPRRPNLHIMVADDPAFDAALVEDGVDEQAHYIASFTGRFEEEGVATPKIWIPLLGENRLTQFDRIFDLVKPDEVCGVLPSPSLNPRRADDIVLQYRRALLEELNMDPRDFLYASERNPFEVYRQLRYAIAHYHHVFDVVGGCRVALSALSSKLSSIGALLVAYELSTAGRAVGVAHVDCQRQLMQTQVEARPEVFSVYLAGEYDGQ
jgi:hypothetical protein